MRGGSLILVDTSAISQSLVNDRAAEALRSLAAASPLATCLPVVLEVLYSARDASDYERRRWEMKSLNWLEMNERVAKKAMSIQRDLVAVGHHRRPSSDLMIAATADVHKVPILHYDRDFDLIAQVTGQPTQWIVPRGSGH